MPQPAATHKRSLTLAWHRALDLIEFCRQNGVKSIIMTAMPWNSLHANENTRRQALSVTLRTLSSVATIVDAARQSTPEDPANTKNLLAAYDTGDGLLPNDAGHEAVAVAAKELYRRVGLISNPCR